MRRYLLVLFYISLVGCVSSPTSSELFHLTSKQLQLLVARANDRDAGAAYRIYEYYAYSKKDQMKAMEWMERAAELGHQGSISYLRWERKQYDLTFAEFRETLSRAKNGDSDAAYRLVSYYGYSKRDREKAEYWVERAANLGHPAAKAYVQQRNGNKKGQIGVR